MSRLTSGLKRIRDEEQGHVLVGVPSLAAAIGAVLLAYGAAGESDWVTVTGGFILGIGILITGVARHRTIDYDVWTRLDRLEK
jgi:hypothetical protein